MIDMQKMLGFTLIEMILTIILTAIMAAVIIEIIAGPIQAYFWVTDRALKIENAEISLDNVANELKNAFLPSIDISKNGQDLTFRKILFKGVLLPKSNEQQTFYPIGGQLDSQVFQGRSYDIYFPGLAKNQTQLYKADLNKQHSDRLVIEKDFPPLTKPAIFYLLSTPIRYSCEKAPALLERLDLATQDKALLGEHIQHCEFSLYSHDNHQGILIALEFGQATGKKTIKMVTPLFFENAI